MINQAQEKLVFAQAHNCNYQYLNAEAGPNILLNNSYANPELAKVIYKQMDNMDYLTIY